MNPRFLYRATIPHIVDGDTLLLDIDLGFSTTRRQRIRLARIDAPELGIPEGGAAKDFLTALLVPARTVVVQTRRADLHGRYVGQHLLVRSIETTIDECFAQGDYVNERMVAEGYARVVRHELSRGDAPPRFARATPARRTHAGRGRASRKDRSPNTTPGQPIDGTNCANPRPHRRNDPPKRDRTIPSPPERAPEGRDRHPPPTTAFERSQVPRRQQNGPRSTCPRAHHHLLAHAGWLVHARDEMNLAAGPGVAVAEFPLKSGHGFADYLLFLDGKAVGVVEAKPAGTTLTGVETQAKKYVDGIPPELDAPITPVPFVYISIGAVTVFIDHLDPYPGAAASSPSRARRRCGSGSRPTPSTPG